MRAVIRPCPPRTILVPARTPARPTRPSALPRRTRGLLPAQELRCIAGAALEELRPPEAGLALEPSSPSESGSHAHLDPHPTQERMTLEPSFLGVMHAAVAWLNVNRGTDANATHIHKPGYWSAVYFAASGGGEDDSSGGAQSASPAAVRANAGRLVFRGGGQSGAATHTYHAVEPTPGTLWLFDGAVPHAVFPTEAAGARVSVAMNFETHVAD